MSDFERKKYIYVHNINKMTGPEGDGLHLLPRLKMSGATPLLVIHAFFMARTEVGLQTDTQPNITSNLNANQNITSQIFSKSLLRNKITV